MLWPAADPEILSSTLTHDRTTVNRSVITPAVERGRKLTYKINNITKFFHPDSSRTTLAESSYFCRGVHIKYVKIEMFFNHLGSSNPPSL